MIESVRVHGFNTSLREHRRRVGRSVEKPVMSGSVRYPENVQCNYDRSNPMSQTVIETVERELNATDRCDRCAAQALNWVEVGGGELLFCNHHMKEHEPAMAAAGYTVHRSKTEV